jgi:four helix bundle protein
MEKSRGMIKAFEDLEVWNRACQLYLDVHHDFKTLKDWSFRDQHYKSTLSISSNIAERFERGSRIEFIRFLFIAKGSSGELRTQLHLANKIGYLNNASGQKLFVECKYISGMIQKLIKSLKANIDKGGK